jgi:hypothetical protein
MKKVVAAALIAFALSPAAAGPDWPATARSDLKAIHDLIAANHPGPVDAENPTFRVWLESGYAKAVEEAAEVRSAGDYDRVLRAYVNGFRDGHVGFLRKGRNVPISWTGFSVYGRTVSDVTVTYAEPDAGVRAGDRLISCDGKSLDTLMAERTDRYWWNAAIAHTRTLHLQHVFFQDADDTLAKLKSCTFSSGKFDLKWRDEAPALVREKSASGTLPSAGPRLTPIAGAWVVRLPTFFVKNEAEAAAFRTLIEDIAAHRSEWENATLIIDVRRNGGGNSALGEKVVAALWGGDWVSYVKAAADGTVDFRASPDNLAAIDAHIAKMTSQEGAQSGSVRMLSGLRQGLAEAMQQNQPLAHFERKPRAAGSPPLNPLNAKVYFLTDNACGSACLDFADVVLKIPGVTHVGLPTYADSVYMEADTKPLPSGLASFKYPMKVYRHRVRGNNVFYTPKFLWTGGPMTGDAAVYAWVKSLP